MFATSRMALQVRKLRTLWALFRPTSNQSTAPAPALPLPARKDTHTSRFHVLLPPSRRGARLFTALRLNVPLLQSPFHAQPAGVPNGQLRRLRLPSAHWSALPLLLHRGHSQRKAPGLRDGVSTPSRAKGQGPALASPHCTLRSTPTEPSSQPQCASDANSSVRSLSEGMGSRPGGICPSPTLALPLLCSHLDPR